MVWFKRLIIMAEPLAALFIASRFHFDSCSEAGSKENDTNMNTKKHPVTHNPVFSYSLPFNSNTLKSSFLLLLSFPPSFPAPSLWEVMNMDRGCCRGERNGPWTTTSLSLTHSPLFVCVCSRASQRPLPPAQLNTCAWICSDMIIQCFSAYLGLQHADPVLLTFCMIFWYSSCSPLRFKIRFHRSLILWEGINNFV